MEILEQVKQFISKSGLTYTEKEDGGLTVFVKTGPLGSTLRIEADEKFLSAFIHLCFYTPPACRQAMAEAVCRASYSLKWGGFELDMEDGEVRFRSSIPIYNSVITEPQLQCLIRKSWSIAADYAGALLEVAVGAREPEAAIDMVEGEWKEAIRNASVA